jgi:acyl carrier protein
MSERLRHVLSIVLDLPADRIDERLTAEDTSNWDSIRHLDLVMALEEAFGVSFSSEELGELTSYRAIVEALGRHGVA